MEHNINRHPQATDETIRRLRKSDLVAGRSFMYFSDLLPEDQAFFEYPDGSFRIEKFISVSEGFSFVRNATIEEIAQLKEKYADLFA